MLTGLLLCSLITQPVMADEFSSEDQSEIIEQEIESFVKEHQNTTAGMAVSVFSEDEEIYTNYFGYTDKENELKTDEQSVFEWGSATKLLVWTSVMQLYEQGEIDLNEDIRTYLPDGFLTNIKFDKPVTITNLMNHNAGYQEMIYELFVNNESDIKSLGDTLKKYQPEQVFEPGYVTAYSNWSVALAGYIVECISGQEFYEYVNNNIFAVLNMQHSSLKPDYSDNLFVRNQRESLKCYSNDGNFIGFSNYYIQPYPAGSCASTLKDFMTFAQSLINKDSPLFKSEKTQKLLFTPTSMYPGTDIPKNCHGIWMIPFEEPTFGHGGNTIGCSANLLLQPENNLGAVVMTNQAGESIYNSEMMEIIFGKYNSDNYFSDNNKLQSGYFKPARTILKGKLKLYSLTFLDSSKIDKSVFFVQDKESGIMSMPYGDYIPCSKAKFIFELSLIILFAISIIMCITMLIIKLVQKLCQKEKRPLGKWAVASMLIQFLLPVSVIYAAVNLLNNQLAESFLWIFKCIAILLLLLIVLFIFGLYKTIKTQMKKRTRAFCILTMFTLAVSITNILYWNMFMFWKA